MKRYVRCASTSSRLSKNMVRRGILYFDRYEWRRMWKQPHAELVKDRSKVLLNEIAELELHYYFDTQLHVEFARLQDIEDWQDAENLVYTSTKNMLLELQSDLIARSNDTELERADTLYCVIHITGAGNREVVCEVGPIAKSAITHIENNFDRTADGYYKLYDWSEIGTYLSRGSGEVFRIGVKLDGTYCGVFNEKNIQPNSYMIRRKFAPMITRELFS